MKDVKERISKLSPAKRAMFEMWSRGEVLTPLKVQEIPCRGGSGPYPLSIEQEHVWLINRVEPNAFFLHISGAYRLEGQLNLEALERAINEIIRRHENLRTTFTEMDGRPVPVIAPELSLKIPLADLGDVAPTERETVLQRRISEHICQPFDLSTGPLIRTALYRLSAQEHALLVILHHIITDRLSGDLFWRELVLLYDAFAKGEPSPLPELPIQYGDFAVWQRQWLDGEQFESHLSYWKQKLENVPPLNLLTDYLRPAISTYPGARERWTLPARLWEEMKSFCLSENATRFMVFLAVYSVWLYRYTGQEDVLIGSPVSNRDRKETEGIIGFFISTLGLRIDLSGNPTFRELLHRVRVVCLEAFAHQDMSIVRVLQELRFKRDANSPLYQTTYVYTNNTQEPAARKLDLNISGLKIFYESTPMVDLAFNAFDAEVGASIAFDYNTELFALSTIRRMIGHFETLLENVLANPCQPISEIPLTSAAERARLLRISGHTPQPFLQDRSLAQLFEAQASRSPQSLALSAAGRQISYGELNRRANRLAHRLRRLGVGPEVFVAVLMRRSIEMLVALLGVLKAGGAYVPLDPASPPERLALMLEQTAAPVLLTELSLLSAVESAGRQVQHVLCSDAEWEAADANGTRRAAVAKVEAETEEAESWSNPASGVVAENLAYVIYTSGSTGRPKGVEITQRSLHNLIDWHVLRYRVTADDRATHLAGVGFDAAVWEIWPYLCNGASLHLPEEDVRSSPVELQRWLIEEGITLSFVPTPMAEILMQMDWPQGVALRSMLTGGDRLSHHAPARLGFEVVNHYGPTESTVVASAGVVGRTPGAGADSRAMPGIGRAIANTSIYVLDTSQRMVPEGLQGEIYIAGEAVGRGYVRDAAQTAERFLPDPYGEKEGGRMYRTGDLGRFVRDGELEYLGRADEQVKVRGYRIELGEIETVLDTHPSVRMSVVAAIPDGSGGQRLAAYIVAHENGAGQGEQGTPDVGEIRVYLKKKLPEYMVPSAFVLLDALPLTPNGKVDRRALPSPETSGGAGESEYTGPRTAIEEVLSGTWWQLLGVERVGINDNFFALGAHSLVATQIFPRVSNAFEMDISLRDCFDKPTIAEMGALIEKRLIAEIGEFSDDEAREESQREF